MLPSRSLTQHTGRLLCSKAASRCHVLQQHQQEQQQQQQQQQQQRRPFSTGGRTRSREDGRDNLRVFEDNATKWWNGKEFSLLRAMNKIRVPFIVDGLGRAVGESRILDVGCGGGLLSEPLARLGADVLGIDPVSESINQAQLHAQAEPGLAERLRYRNCNVEDLSWREEQREAYDAVVASEVLEHVEDVESFLVHCQRLLRPEGSLFVTTINQTALSWLGVILMGEYVLQQLPRGTHQYELFVNLKGLRVMLERLGMRVRLVSGFMYEPLSGTFHWTPTTLTHYALQATKASSAPRAAGGLNLEQRRHAPRRPARPERPKVVLERADMLQLVDVDQFEARAAAIASQLAEHLERALATRLTAQALGQLEVRLEGLDAPVQLAHLARISSKGPGLLVVNLAAQPEAIKPTLAALAKLANLQPQVEVNNVYVALPRVTREHRERTAKAAKQATEAAKERLRGLFSEFASLAKGAKAKGVSLDTERQVLENLQWRTRTRLAELDGLLERRTRQLLNEL